MCDRFERMWLQHRIDPDAIVAELSVHVVILQRSFIVHCSVEASILCGQVTVKDESAAYLNT